MSEEHTEECIRDLAGRRNGMNKGNIEDFITPQRDSASKHIAEQSAEVDRLSRQNIALRNEVDEVRRLLAESRRRESALMVVIGDVYELQSREGESVTIPCDNDEADTVERQACVEVNGEHTDWEPQVFFGVTWTDALHKAANSCRSFYIEESDP